MLNVFTPLEETRAQGKVERLKRLLTRRFGPLPAPVSARITPPGWNNLTPGRMTYSMPNRCMVCLAISRSGAAVSGLSVAEGARAPSESCDNRRRSTHRHPTPTWPINTTVTARTS